MLVGDTNIYNELNVGKCFLSIDLKKANFQALHNFNPEIVMGCDNYEDLMDYFGGDDYFKHSKYTRQVIFGKLNPKRTIQYEKYLIKQLFQESKNEILKFLYDNTKLVSVKTDELIFHITDENIISKINLTDLKKEIKNNNNLDVHVEIFTLYRIVSENHNNVIVDGYKKVFYNDKNRYDLKNVSSIFFPQIYSFANGLEINEYDLYFNAEGQVAKFCNPLKLIGIYNK